MAITRDHIVPTIHHICHSAASKLTQINFNDKEILTIDSGEEVSFDNTHAGFSSLHPGSTDADLQAMDLQGVLDVERVVGPIYVDGPVFVRGAEPGDTLKVDILALETGDWGWTAIFPGLGLLQEEFPGPHVKTFSLHADGTVFKEGVVKIPHAPFYGTMGVAPPESAGACHPLFPRNDMGGNFDCRYLGVGSTLYLPVNVPGALFSVGDAHFSQGDGEITGVALETTMRSRFRLSVLKPGEQGWLRVSSPQYDTNPELTAAMHAVGGKGEHGVLVTASTREEAVKAAVRGAIDWMATKGLTPFEAYMLFSIVGNLKIHHDLGLEIHTVSASVPLGVFV